ncbi:hypothetical protein REMIM1_PE00514 (plasmid) [Rhizobium etli bv. mimosae str. Mim1]|nr:hypothetical protein REMIM1_PE00514 [Rhizobium etli bv. mimosae str. Mim1]
MRRLLLVLALMLSAVPAFAVRGVTILSDDERVGLGAIPDPIDDRNREFDEDQSGRTGRPLVCF